MSFNVKHNYYRDLLIPPSANLAMIKRAKRIICRATHTDTNNGSEEYRSLFEAAIQAYDILSDETLRSRYDRDRLEYLSRLGAIRCAGCGEGLRVGDGIRSQRCPLCKTAVASDSQQRHSAQVPRPLRESAARLGNKVIDATQEEAELLGRVVVRHGAELLAQAVSAGFQRLRRKLNQ